MTIAFPDLLVVADEVVAALDERPLATVTLHDRTVDGIYANVHLQLKWRQTTGSLLEIATEMGLTEVDIHSKHLGIVQVRGKHGDATVELMAPAA